MDRKQAADHFQSLEEVPPPNVRLLQDLKARRADVNEVLANRLPLREAKNAIAIDYFSGGRRDLSPIKPDDKAASLFLSSLAPLTPPETC